MSMKTILHTYNFNTSNPEQASEYAALVARLTADGCKVFKALGDYECTALAGEITLDATYLFANQWNTVATDDGNGHRVFDWAEDAIFYNGRENHNVRRGHWLEQTDEMRAIRRETLKCGYCGKQITRTALAQRTDALSVLGFCAQCIDSEYLKDEDLRLLRLEPVAAEFGTPRAPITDEERAVILPLYVDAQVHGATERGKVRIARLRKSIVEECNATIRNATTKRDGFTWLMDHAVNTDNVIYYPHTGRFAFGWRTALAPEVKAQLLDVLCEFPFDYDIVEPKRY
jgi:hypothetical protein